MSDAKDEKSRNIMREYEKKIKFQSEIDLEHSPRYKTYDCYSKLKEKS